MMHETLRRLPPLLVLTGFRATGKTAVGRHLARLCGYEFADTDALLAERMGCSVAEAVERHGWPHFREQEQLLLAELVSRRNTVLATGGGAILHQQEWQLLRKQAVVIWLRTDLAATLARLRQDEKTAGQRPRLLSQADDDLETETVALLKEREPLYRAGSDLVIETGGRTAEEAARKLFFRLTKNGADVNSCV
ncbi:shikimate kinase [Candidatus Electronema sp. JC]|uniref:shikimate kinase n=1 Tax=Candidatus Electronema sp. JC TaxID=3401570 RepID=UPI003AA7B61D